MRASISLQIREPKLSRRTLSLIRKCARGKLRNRHTLVPHAREMIVAATTDSTLAVFSLSSDIVVVAGPYFGQNSRVKSEDAVMKPSEGEYRQVARSAWVL